MNEIDARIATIEGVERSIVNWRRCIKRMQKRGDPVPKHITVRVAQLCQQAANLRRDMKERL